MSRLLTGWGLPQLAALGGAFSPLSLSPALWLKADVGTYQSANTSVPATQDGDLVRFWQDQSGNGNGPSQGTSSKRPALFNNVQNGLPIVRFDGVDDWLNIATTFPGETGQTILLAGTRTGAPAFGMMVVTRDASQELRWDGLGAKFQADINAGAGTVTSGSTYAGWHALGSVQGGGAMTLYADGAADGTASDSTALATISVSIGARSGTNPFAGDLGEVLIFPVALSAPNLASVFAYLKARWGTP